MTTLRDCVLDYAFDCRTEGFTAEALAAGECEKPVVQVVGLKPELAEQPLVGDVSGVPTTLRL